MGSMNPRNLSRSLYEEPEINLLTMICRQAIEDYTAGPPIKGRIDRRNTYAEALHVYESARDFLAAIGLLERVDLERVDVERNNGHGHERTKRQP